MKVNIATLIAALATALVAPNALADTGSDWLNGQVSHLQQQLVMRNALHEEAVRFARAQGYGVPEQLLAHADDDAIQHEVAQVNRAIRLYAMAEF
jgi:hypothetical protein